MEQKEYEVEKMLISKLQEMRYDFVQMSDYADVESNFRRQLCKFNAKAISDVKGKPELSDAEFERVLTYLKGHDIYTSAKLLRDKYVLPLDSGKTVYIEFLSEDDTWNIFQVTHQVTMDPAHVDDVLYKNRYDVTVLINGLPLIQIELKRPGIEINEAINQINRYRRHSFSGLFKYIQFFIVSNSTMTKYFANENETYPNGQRQDILKSLSFYWTDDKNVRINPLIKFVDDFMPCFRVTELLTKFFIIKQAEPVLMIMRPYQIYAVKLSFDRVIMANQSGFVFHTTGSGKTLTSFKLASLLRDNNTIDKVFFLIDRSDLDDQTVEEYNSFEKDCVDTTESTRVLMHMLSHPTKDNKMIITTIQKMACALRAEKYKNALEPYREKKCIFIIDECHRSQFGKMHGDIKRHFQNANYIGFTGTPIFAQNRSGDGRTTADVFSSGSMDPCIHSYMIKEAIADGNVLRFSVEYNRSLWMRNAKPGIDPEMIDDPEYCAKNNIDMTNAYHDPNRIKDVSKNIFDNLDRHTHLSGTDIYTALFAVDRIQTLWQYYKYMKENGPLNAVGKPMYKIAAIFTFAPNEDYEEQPDNDSRKELEECINDYNKMFGTAFSVESFDGYRKDIMKRMKQKNLPQIDLLLVVDMFLTGFDSKPTNTLILDKNLVWHSLVQAYSRTNRVDRVTKQYGQIITYRNIKKWQDEALRLYSGDGNASDYLLESYEYYVAQFHNEAGTVKSVAPTPDDIGHLQSEDDIRKFIIAFRKLSQTLATLKTFGKFDQLDINSDITEQEYADYKSWYLYYYDQQKQKAKEGEETIYADLDFNIELIRTDRINVVYILNLLRDVDRSDTEKMTKDADLILRELERSDNAKLRSKKELMKEFIMTRFFQLKPEEDIMQAYGEFEKDSIEKDISSFSDKTGISRLLTEQLISQYFADPRTLTNEIVRKKLEADGIKGILRQTSVTEGIMGFAEDMKDKYTGEDE